jgi:formylglycine-generating enzyme required for sulfatase activity
MKKRLFLGFVVAGVLAGIVIGIGSTRVPAQAQDEDMCKGLYELAQPQLEQAQAAAEQGNANGVVEAINAIQELLAPCGGMVYQDVFLPAGTSDQSWTPIGETFNNAEMVLVPPGCFMMGSEDWADDEKPVHKVCFNTPFWIDKTEVTRAMYQACIDDGTCTDPVPSVFSTRDTQPINGISWRQADDYCAWRGTTLPTEAQWEYAARGPESRIYPWADPIFVRDYSVYGGNAQETADVGSLPAGASWVGALDMSGNVWEWVADWYNDDYYSTLPDGAINPPGPDGGYLHVLRGGSIYEALSYYMHITRRLAKAPGFESDIIGARCARPLPLSIAPTDACETRYEQISPMLQDLQADLADGHANFVLSALDATRSLLEPCVKSNEVVMLPAGSSNSAWTPLTMNYDETEMVQVPAGCFMMGSADGENDEQPPHEVCFDAPFWIDKTEVTRASYAACVAAGACAETPTPDYYTYDTLPITRVTWDQAQSFCAWRGVRLPTEAEWEYAARGPEDLVYPWGNDFVRDDVVYGASSSGPVEVGTKPAGASWVGALDMSGNVWEWVADWYNAGYYGTLEAGVVSPAGPTEGNVRVLRGGGFGDSEYFLRTTVRGKLQSDDEHADSGFRCARSD